MAAIYLARGGTGIWRPTRSLHWPTWRAVRRPWTDQRTTAPAGSAIFFRRYFFSVQTLATIGYGRISPIGIPANLIVAIESLVGLVTFALITGIAFARFSRPRPAIRFSDYAVVAPDRGITAFMFRLANTRDSELFDVSAEVAIARRRSGGTINERVFESLSLERAVGDLLSADVDGGAPD